MAYTTQQPLHNNNYSPYNNNQGSYYNNSDNLYNDYLHNSPNLHKNDYAHSSHSMAGHNNWPSSKNRGLYDNSDLSSRTIDVPVEQLFTKFDRGHNGHLTRVEIAEMLTDIFRSFGIHNPVTEEDVDNFLIDYDIMHRGDLTREDFLGISKLRFVLTECSNPKTEDYTSKLSNSRSTMNVRMPHHTPEVRKITIPVRMLFDVFNKGHDGRLSRQEIMQVLNLIFRDFHMPYTVNESDVENFLLDFDIDHDRQITMADFPDVDVLNFELHHGDDLRFH